MRLFTTIAFACFLFAQSASADYVRNYLINPYTGQVDTNRLIIQRYNPPELGEAGVVGVDIANGKAVRSPWTNFFDVGYYSISNPVLRSAYIIRVDSNSQTLYDATQRLHQVVGNPTILDALKFVKTNGVRVTSTNLNTVNFVNGANTTVTGAVVNGEIRIGISSSGSGGGSATNVNFIDSSNIHADTVGGSNRFTAFGLVKTNETVNLVQSGSNYYSGRQTFAGVTNDFLKPVVLGSAASQVGELRFYSDDGFYKRLFGYDGGLGLSTKLTIIGGNLVMSGGSVSAESFLGNLYGSIAISDSQNTNLVTDLNAGTPLMTYNVGLDKIVFPRGLAGDGSDVANLNPANIVGVVTNASIPTFDSLRDLLASGITNQQARIVGYWGSSNYFGGGDLIRRSGVTLTTNFGTIFTNIAAANSYWERDRKEATNFYRAEWFGVIPMNTDAPSTRTDSYQRLTNCFDVAGDSSVVQLPPFGLMVSQTIVATNWRFRTIVGSGPTRAGLFYPERSSWIAYQGVGGANSAVLRMWSPYQCLIDGVGIEADTPIYTGSGAYPTNHAEIGIEIDQAATYSQIAHNVTIRNGAIRTRGTNSQFNAVWISRTSLNNCEQMVVDNVLFQGNGNIDLTATGNTGYGIVIGNSPNSRQHTFRNISLVGGFQANIVCSNGGFATVGKCNGDGATYDFKLSSWADSVSIGNWFSENNRQCFWINSGAGSGGKTYPVKIDGYHSSHGAGSTNLALFELHGAARIDLQNSAFYCAQNQRVFTNDAPPSGELRSVFNTFGHPTPITVDSSLAGVTNFNLVDWVNNDIGSGTNYGYKYGGWTYDIVDSATRKPHTLFGVENRVLVLQPNQENGVTVGRVASALTDSAFAVQVTNQASPKVSFGDAILPRRYSFPVGGAAGDSAFTMQSTNGRSSIFTLVEESGPSFLQIDAGFNRQDIIWTNGSLFHKLGDSIYSTMSSQGITLSPSNNVINLVSTQINLNGSITLTGMFNWRTNMPSDWPAAPANRGEAVLVNSNGTLYALLSGPNGNTWLEANAVAPNASQIVQEFSGTPTGSKFLRDDGTLAVPAGGGGSQTPWTSDIDGAAYNLTNVTGVRVKSGGIGTAVSGGDLNLYVNGDRVGMVLTGGASPNIRLGPDSLSFGFASGGSGMFAGASNTNNAASGSVILGGGSNVIDTGSGNSVILGGGSSVVSANYGASIAGRYNWVSNNSVAIGSNAKATNTGTIVLSAQQESTSVAVNTLSNQTIILYAPNGVGVNTNQITTNAFFVLGSGTITSNWNVGGKITGDGSILTNVNELVETVNYPAAGSNITLNWSYSGGRLLLTNNACITNISGLVSNQFFHNYILQVAQNTAGTWQLYIHTNVGTWQGGTNGIIATTTNAGASDTYYMHPTYWGTNVNIGQGSNWKPL